MIIDAHVHISLDGKNSKGVPELLASMDRAGIDRAAVFAATIAGLTTPEVMRDIAEHQDRLFAIGSISPIILPFKAGLRKVEDWLREGVIRGLKFYTGYEHFYPSDERICPYLEVLNACNRPAIFHCGDTYDKHGYAKLKYAHPLAIDDLASEMPDLKIIIAHMGSPWIVDAAQVCYKNKNVYVDTSGFTYGTFTPRRAAFFARLWEEFDLITESNSKILFGSDWPISDQSNYVELIKTLAGEHAEKIFYKNAEMLFGL